MSSSQLNNLRVNNLLTENLVVNNDNVNQDIENIKNILKPGLYTSTVNNVNETLFIVHNADNENNDIIKWFIIVDRTIKITNVTFKNNKMISTTKIITENNTNYKRISEFLIITNNSIKKNYSGYKYSLQRFIKNGYCEINLIDVGFEVLVYDENKVLIEKNIYTKLN